MSMGKTLSVDPGVRGCGIAVWEAGVLIHAEYVKSAVPGCWRSMANAVCNRTDNRGYQIVMLVVEVPKVYQGRKQKGDPNDLIEVAGVVGAIVGTYSGAQTRYYPHEWKKQLPKSVCVERIKQRLTAEELTKVRLPSAKSLAHNVHDAVGIGCHFHGRHLY